MPYLLDISYTKLIKKAKIYGLTVNVASLAMVVSVFLGNILGGGFLDALGKLSDFFSGKSNSAVNALISEAFANPLAASRTAQSFVDGLQTGSKNCNLQHFLVLLNGLGICVLVQNGGVNTTSLQAAYMDLSNKVKNLSLYFGFIILLCISRCRIYWIFLIPSS